MKTINTVIQSDNLSLLRKLEDNIEVKMMNNNLT